MDNLVIEKSKKTNNKAPDDDLFKDKQGYKENQLIFVTYSPPLKKYHTRIITETSDDVFNTVNSLNEEDSEDEDIKPDVLKMYEAKLKRIKRMLLYPFQQLQLNSYKYVIEAGKGGNFHIHALIYIQNRLEFDLWIGEFRCSIQKPIELDYRRVTQTEIILKYFAKDVFYGDGKYPYANNPIDKIIKKMEEEKHK